MKELKEMMKELHKEIIKLKRLRVFGDALMAEKREAEREQKRPKLRVIKGGLHV